MAVLCVVDDTELRCAGGPAVSIIADAAAMERGSFRGLSALGQPGLPGPSGKADFIGVVHGLPAGLELYRRLPFIKAAGNAGADLLVDCHSECLHCFKFPAVPTQ